MRSARLPFKLRDTDPEWGTALVLIPDTLWDELRLWFGRYRRAYGRMWGRVWYDPGTVSGREYP